MYLYFLFSFLVVAAVVVVVDDDDDDDDDVDVDVVAVFAVLRMRDSRAITFGSRCFNQSVILRFVSDFRGLF